MTAPRPLRLAWAADEGRACLHVEGWTAAELRELGELPPAALGRRFAVFPTELIEGGADVRALQPVAGRFAVAGDAVCFIPRFPFVDGASSTLFFDPAGGVGGGDGLEVVGTIQRPAAAGAPVTDVLAIYPTAVAVPVNLLRLYIHFSQPMSEGWAGRAVHVRRADTGEPLHGVFLAMRTELWDRERRRLTLLLDPGRIKRGLAPNEEAGYPLIEGVPVIVTIDPAFRDAAGRPLRSSAERHYQVGPPLRARVVPADWRLSAPAAGSRQPLTLTFDRPLDHGLLQHALSVCDAEGASVAGRVVVEEGETSWQFAPELPWAAGGYTVTVEPRLEDLAGNSVTRVFDRDLTRAEDEPAAVGRVFLGFRCATPVLNATAHL